MAAEGMLFTDAYAGSPVSAPSRASLMTGQHTGQEPDDPNHIILPEIMKDNGYNTGIFGKRAGGYEGSISTPDKRGIDEHYGFMYQFQATSTAPTSSTNTARPTAIPKRHATY